jgi:acyl carrier protein
MIQDIKGDEISRKVKGFIIDDNEDAGMIFNDEENLFELGLFDSFTIVSLVAFIEKQFFVSLDFEDLTEDKLKNVSSIVNLIISKLNQKEKR